MKARPIDVQMDLGAGRRDGPSAPCNVGIRETTAAMGVETVCSALAKTILKAAR